MKGPRLRAGLLNVRRRSCWLTFSTPTLWERVRACEWMTTSSHRASAAVLLLALASIFAAGCDNGSGHDGQTAARAQQLEADVHREAVPRGEIWRATTTTRGKGPRPSWVTIREEARLDSSGKLLGSETRIADDIGSPEVRVMTDLADRRVIVERSGRHVEWSVPDTNEPWILTPVRGPAGETIPTPLVAWTTWRATRHAEWVRLVNPLEQKTFIVPRDQYVVDQTVIVGEEPVQVDDQFVRSIAIGGVELDRRAGDIHAAFRFRAPPPRGG